MRIDNVIKDNKDINQESISIITMGELCIPDSDFGNRAKYIH